MAELIDKPKTKKNLYLGIDPGVHGGAGVVDSQGNYVDCWRWREVDPLHAWYRLMNHMEDIAEVLIETVRIFAREGMGKAVTGQKLLENAGRWKQMVALLELPWREIVPTSWQAKFGLHNWRKKELELARLGLPTSPLALARVRFPEAPLEFLADDGKAVGLLLADLARLESPMGKNDRFRGPSGNDRGVTKAKGRAKKTPPLTPGLKRNPPLGGRGVSFKSVNQ